MRGKHHPFFYDEEHQLALDAFILKWNNSSLSESLKAIASNLLQWSIWNLVMLLTVCVVVDGKGSSTAFLCMRMLQLLSKGRCSGIGAASVVVQQVHGRLSVRLWCAN